MDFYELTVRTGSVLLLLLPYVLWCAFWLWAVNWKKAWAVLAQGGWAPLVLLMGMVTMVWSRVAPGPCDCLGFVRIPNFWWQLGDVLLLVGLAFFCGWLQGYLQQTPFEVEVEPVPEAHGHGQH